MQSTTPHPPDALPVDAAALRELLLASRAELAASQATVRRQAEELERLRLQLAKLRRMQFGRSSERLQAQIAQLELAIEALGGEPAGEAVAAPPATKPARQSAPRTPRALPAHLSRETQRHEGPCACPSCGGVLVTFGEDVSEVLEYVPASFRVIRHVRPKQRCRACAAVVQAPAAERPIARGLAGPGLLAHVLVAKYCDHLPLYRQAQIYAREGVAIERSTLADWVGAASALLAPLGEALERHVLGGASLHADDTPVPVLDPGRGRTRTARLWTYVREERGWGGAAAPAVVFRYSADRKGIHPQRHLAGYRGTLQADGYAGFGALYASGRIEEAACWAHVRRKFHDVAAATDSPLAREALARIGALYALEAEIRGRPAEVRRAAREARAGPLVAGLRTWLEEILRTLSAKSALAAAAGYALGRWEALARYLGDGRLEIDNNAAERALRTVALGRKNYLFMGSDHGGERAALIYSLIGSARLNGLDPFAYLRTVLERIAEHPIREIDALLPWNLAAELGDHRRQAA
ncbi:IS66 family transposase [Spiribacter halobius]|nr:IS66 family transposase [Spiribacter halobius]UEX77728.1 IS66 family transposase [Spiribacter halobius]